MRDLSRVGARVGITTGATLSRLSLASWFLEKNGWVLGTKTPLTSLTGVWCVSLPGINLPCLPEPRVKRKTVLEAMLQRGLFKGFQWSLTNWCNPRGRFQEGMSFRPLGLSLKTAQETSKILIVLKFIGELPSCQQ